MTRSTNDGFEERQLQVQRWLGRCMIRLQQYGRLLKAIVADNNISGPSRDLEAIRDARIRETNGMTLGTLVGQFIGTQLITDGADASPDMLKNIPDDVLAFGFHMHVMLSTDDYARAQDDLRELVTLRNNLVHHFIEQHDLRSMEGCNSAHAALVTAYARIDQCYQQLQTWEEWKIEARQQFAEFMKSDAFHEALRNGIDGINSDGTVDWPAAGIVRVLREASGQLAVKGWTPVKVAQEWISQHHSEQTPDRYGCVSLRQILHESRLFELRYLSVNGQSTACYRARTQ